MSYDYFDHLLEEIREQLLTLTQGRRTIAEFALDLCTLAVGSQWNELALTAAFCQGMNMEVLTELMRHDDQGSLDSLVDMTIHLDKLALSGPLVFQCLINDMLWVLMGKFDLLPFSGG